LPFDFLDQRPIVIAIAGSNGAGKTTFYESFLADSGLRFINADTIADALGIDAHEAAEVATAIRSALVKERGSFIFETVLSDPVGDQLTTASALRL
jgi:predicted ABC-type ATPase